MKSSQIIVTALIFLLAIPSFAHAQEQNAYVLLPTDNDALQVKDLPFSLQDNVVSSINDGLVINTKPSSVPAGMQLVKPSAVSVSDDPESWKQWTMSEQHYNLIYPAGWTGAGVVVAVIDTGSVASHPDKYRVIQGFNSLADDPEWGDAYNDPADTTDDHGHGTHVASIIGEPVNGIGYQGVAGDVTIMPVKAMDAAGAGTGLSVATAITWAADNGADIINLSLGGSEDDGRIMGDAVDYAASKGIAVVCASGNSYDISPNNMGFPAEYDSCLSVGAVDATLARLSFSQGGPQLDLTAPGTARFIDHLTNDYTGGSGTSYAAPHVAGLVALLMGGKQGVAGVTAGQAVQTIKSTATDKGASGWDGEYGWGVMNPVAALGITVPGGETNDTCWSGEVTVVSGATITLPMACSDTYSVGGEALRGLRQGNVYTAPLNWDGLQTITYSTASGAEGVIRVRVLKKKAGLAATAINRTCLRIKVSRTPSWNTTKATVFVYLGTKRVRTAYKVGNSVCIRKLAKSRSRYKLIVKTAAAPGLTAASRTIFFRA